VEQGDDDNDYEADFPDEKDDLGQYLVGSWKESAEKALKEDLEGLDGGPVRQHPFGSSNKRTKAQVEKTAGRALGIVRSPGGSSGADAASTRSVLSGVSVNGDTNFELERAEATVRSKLKECRRALAGLEVGDGSDANTLAQIENLVAVLGTCGQALSKLRQTQGAAQQQQHHQQHHHK
jgi:hypothetical protein